MKFRTPSLKLVHKGILLVALPLLVQTALYLEQRREADIVARYAEELDIRRDISGRANELSTMTFFGFQSLMQYKMVGRSGDLRQYKLFETNFPKKVDELADLLRTQSVDKARVDQLSKLGHLYIDALKISQFNPDEHNQVGSFYDDLARNQRLKVTMRDLFILLKNIVSEEQVELTKAAQLQEAQRLKLKSLSDAGVIVNAIVAVLAALLFGVGAAKRLRVMKENTQRFKAGKFLLPPLSAGDEIGELDAVFHSMVDEITASRIKEQKNSEWIKESKDRLELVIANVPSALLVVKDNGIVESANPRTEKLFLYAKEAMVGMHLNDLLACEQAKGEPAEFVNYLVQNTAAKLLKVDALDAEGEFVPVEISAINFRIQDGNRVLVSLTDISERVKLEQLRQQFYAMVGHDLRAPLTSICGVLQLAGSGKYKDLPSDLTVRLSKAERTAFELVEMVNRLLYAEQLEAARLELVREDADVYEICNIATSAVQRQVEEKNIVVETELRCSRVLGDAHYLGQVLTNLLGNAIKFSPDGGRIVVSAREDDDTVLFSVKDEGPGIPPEHLHELFERFKQVDSRRDRKKGFGLGLSICKTLVELHGGTIGVDSAPGGGSTFWFRIPQSSEAVAKA